MNQDLKKHLQRQLSDSRQASKNALANTNKLLDKQTKARLKVMDLVSEIDLFVLDKEKTKEELAGLLYQKLNQLYEILSYTK